MLYDGDFDTGIDVERFTDADMDTKIEVENEFDDDEIMFSLKGQEHFKMQKNAAGEALIHINNIKSNTLVGFEAGLLTGTDSTFINSGKYNTGLGYGALRLNTNGLTNTAVGYVSMYNNETGAGNSAFGGNSLVSNTSGDYNTAIGESSLQSNETGFYNVGVGFNSLAYSASGSNSVAVGYRAGLFETSTSRNVYIGKGAGTGGSTTADFHTKSNNVMIGYNAGEQCQGSNNVFLGYESGQNETGNNRLYIENSDNDSDDALIYSEFDNNILKVNGELGINITGSPTDQLQLNATAGNNAAHFQVNGQTKLRVYNNGSIALGAHSPTVTSNDVYVANDIGIGVTSPVNRLHAQHNADGDFVAKIENVNTNPKSHGLIVEVGPSSNVTSSNIFIAFQDQNGTEAGTITGDD